MAERANTIVVMENCEPISTYGSVRDMCNNMPGFSYHYLKGKSKFPYEYKGYKIFKTKFR